MIKIKICINFTVTMQNFMEIGRVNCLHFDESQQKFNELEANFPLFIETHLGLLNDKTIRAYIKKQSNGAFENKTNRK